MNEIDKKNLYKKIIEIRISQLLINEIIKSGDLNIPIHLGLGHESIAAAIDYVLDEGDSLFLTHRNMHYNIARAESLKKEIDEYYLKSSGMASARLGSMNLSNRGNGIPYSSSILGNNFAVATGFALGNKILSDKHTTMVITGDGAIEEGAFYESLLFQRSNDLKVMTIVENNEWSLGSKIDERRCKININSICDALSIPYLKLSGNDPINYVENLLSVIEHVQKQNTPYCIEVNLKTLGYWYEDQDGYPNGKFINYHSGKAPRLNIEDNPILEDSENDPLKVIESIIGQNLLREIFDSTLTKLSNEIK